MRRVEWPDDDSVEFHLPHGELIALLRESGFEIEELIEVQPGRRGDHEVSVGDARVGAQLADRGGLEGAPPLSASARSRNLRCRRGFHFPSGPCPDTFGRGTRISWRNG